MDILDILKEESPELYKKLRNNMYDFLGFGLCKRTFEVFRNKDKAFNWFYSKIIALENKRPYDLAKEGNLSEIENELKRIEHGLIEWDNFL